MTTSAPFFTQAKVEASQRFSNSVFSPIFSTKFSRRVVMVLILLASLFFLDLILNAQNANAAVSPVSIGLVPPIQFPSNEYAITGARISLLWGHQRNVYGLDLGLIGNITDQDFTGLGVSGLFNITHGTTTALGLQAALGANYNTNKTTVIGLQAALGANVNTAESTINGLQLALVNLSEHSTINGFQLGLYNKAQTVHGVQIGVINVVNNLHGLQIGVLNFNSTGMFAVSPILNFGF